MRTATGLALATLAVAAAGCDAGPRTQYIHWVARDAWDPGCAHEAIIEKWEDSNRHFEDKGGQKVYVVDVKATFKLVNACASGEGGKRYAQFEAHPFEKQGLEMVACTSKDGEKGWSLVGGRCWSGPNPPTLE